MIPTRNTQPSTHMTEDTNPIQAAINAGAALNAFHQINGVPAVVVPEGYGLQSLEHMLPSPARKVGFTSVFDAESFIAVVKSDFDKVHTRLYCSTTNPAFKALFNDHGADVAPAGWKDHGVSYACPTSTEWKTWTVHSGKQMNQESFAQFIENNLPDIANPPAAEMLEISRTLEAKKKVNFASGVRLSNGQNELTYEEEISGTAAKGKFKVPEEFTIGIPVLEGGNRYAVTARLRYRIADGGKMTMWFELVRPHKILEDAFNAVRVHIEQAVGMRAINGAL
jgi:uncharacterized protein YfdQ (DUF2303 family)